MLDEVRTLLRDDPATAGTRRGRAPLPGGRVLDREELTVALSTYEFTVVRAWRRPPTVFEVSPTRPVGASGRDPPITVSEWEREGDPAPGGVGAVRKLGRWPAFTREEITEYAPPHHLAYAILSGLPVRGYHADVDVFPTTTRQHDSGGRVRSSPRCRAPVRCSPCLRRSCADTCAASADSRAPAREAEDAVRHRPAPRRPRHLRQEAATRFRSETDRYLLPGQDVERDEGRGGTLMAGMEQLEGRTAVVTGAASGIGLATTEAFVGRGHARADDRPRRGEPLRARGTAARRRGRRALPGGRRDRSRRHGARRRHRGRALRHAATCATTTPASSPAETRGSCRSPSGTA